MATIRVGISSGYVEILLCELNGYKNSQLSQKRQMKGTYVQSEMIIRIQIGGFHMMEREVSGDRNMFPFFSSRDPTLFMKSAHSIAFLILWLFGRQEI